MTFEYIKEKRKVTRKTEGKKMKYADLVKFLDDVYGTHERDWVYVIATIYRYH